MKTLLLIALLALVGCEEKSECPSRARPLDFKYGAKVKVTEGFYRDQTGVLVESGSGIRKYGDTICFNMPEYSVKFDNSEVVGRLELQQLELL